MAKPDHMRLGDFAPVIRRQALRGETPVELPEGTTVTLRLRRDGSEETTDHTGEVEDSAAGLVRYRWQEGEPVPVSESASMTEPAIFWVVFEIEVPNVGRIAVPTIGEDILVVHPRNP